MIRVLLSDDHNLFREGVLLLLKEEPDITVVGEAEDGLMLITKFNELKPDVIVTDISMPGKSGPEAVRTITSKNENVKVLFLSQYSGDDYIYSVLKAGGAGLINKNVIRAELLFAIRTVAEGGRYFAGKSDQDLEAIQIRFELIRKKEKRENVDILTEREMAILLLINESLSSKEIAQRLKVSKRTIDSHRLKIINKLQLKSMPGLIGFARDFARQNKSENNSE